MTHHNTTPTVRFGDMVQNINERILPEDAEDLPYVGLEHLDPESLKIRRWGTPDEVEAQKLRFYASRQTLNRLMAAGYSRREAMERIGAAVVEMIWEVWHEHKDFDRERYRAALEDLE
jgi:hypothetical protein